MTEITISQKFRFFRLPSWFKTYPDAVAAALCAILTLLGWLALTANQVGWAVWILLVAYGVGGYESAREGLTTLWQERELDVRPAHDCGGSGHGHVGAMAAGV